MINFLSSNKPPLLQSLNNLIKNTGLKNIFNPSFLVHGGKIHITFRALDRFGRKPFKAYYVNWDLSVPDPIIIKPADLTITYQQLGIASVSDPKLFIFDGSVWVTFNTGHFEQPNKIFCSRLHPEPAGPYECIYLDRQSIEKNWAFYDAKNTLECIYKLSPLTILKFDKISGGNMHFSMREQRSVPFLDNLTIGTQPVFINKDDQNALIIAHNKIKIVRKRLYLGRAVLLPLSQNATNAAVGPYLAHSASSFLGSTTKHNKNLISCSYFSGLGKINDKFVTSYGINDVDFSFAELSFKHFPRPCKD